MNYSILIAGFGGQGVLSMGRMICYAASGIGLNATFFPSYGGEQRGGTCNCTVIISDEEIGTPVVQKADYIIIMNSPSYEKFKKSAVKGGRLFINTSQVSHVNENENKNAVCIKADDIAVKSGNKLASNMVMLGAFINNTDFISKEEMYNTIKKRMANKPEFLEINLKAFDDGCKG